VGYTTTDLITSITKRGLIPVAQTTFQDEDLVRFMDEELRTIIVPEMMRVRENYFLESYSQTLQASTYRYNLPPRAIGMKIKDMFYVDTNGNYKKLSQTDVAEMTQLELSSNGDPEFFYFIDNFVEILPRPSSSPVGSLVQFYFQRRNRLIETTECGQITAINTGTNTVTLNSVPTAFDSTKVYDFVKGTPGFQNLAIDQGPSGVSGSDFIFSSLPSTLAVNDYLCLAGESPIPQVPLEIHPIVAQHAVMLALTGLNDHAGAERAEKRLEKMKTVGYGLISVRAEEQPKVIVSPNNIGNFFTGR
jgi:hypothetical protein